MLKKLLLILLLVAGSLACNAQITSSTRADKSRMTGDSITISAHPEYDQVSGIHRWLFGENFRKDWAQPVKLPIIRLSKFKGGLSPLKQGGGMESKSLRLEDKDGKEWVLRSVEKAPDKLLPENLQGTFAVDWIGDEFSGQHPYSALIVPPLADAAHVPHANPVIGVVADDAALGQYSKVFTGLICLLEEREPAGPSDNTLKMERALNKSYDNRIDGEMFLRARMLDLLIGDWDRHEDQWRWAGDISGKQKAYIPVPRDRDQVFHVNQGLLPSIAALPWIDPVLGNFTADIPNPKYSIFKTKFLNAIPDVQFSYAQWMNIVNDFVKAETDDVLEAGLKLLPKENYRLRHTELLAILKKRRDNIPAAMSRYFYFINRIVDIHITNKDELLTITGAPDKTLRVKIDKLNKSDDVKGSYMDIAYDPAITEEIRIYVSGGDDHIVVDNSTSPIKLRFVDSTGHKTYDIKNSVNTIPVYGSKDSITFTGKTNRLSNRLSADTNATRFRPTNLYNVWMPLATAAINADDGFLLGLGFKYTGYDGFRKLPYATRQQLLISHAFATNAFRANYSGEWSQIVGKADFVMKANILAPDNTTNFFGRGNETVLVKNEGYRKYYRARFNTLEFDAALRWQTGKGSFLSAGPSVQYYHYSPDDNTGRFISQPSLINSYDSASVNKNKFHLGLMLNFTSNKRNNNVLPFKGYYFEVTLAGYGGLNTDSKAFVQIKPEFTYYLPLDAKGNIVLSDRIGGGISFGKPAFYQSMFLGGQGNLLGYLQNRFAGQNMFFNNLQGRVKIADIASYILPGQLGISGFYDTGRVWISGEHSDKWHTGAGGGLYFAPASLTVLQLLAGHSEEGWYPYISLNFRL